MHTDMSHNADFKRRIAAREVLLGAFIKTPHPMVIEIMGGSAFDFLILDCEHAPFDRSAIDTAMIAGRATGCPLLVRVPHGDASTILGILDSGAAGVMVPHVTSAGQAEALVRALRYGPGGRGFAGTTRAAHYGGRTLKEHLAATADDVSLFCQIEEPEGVENAEAIAAVDGVD
ncbi:MAG: aldolase/citrate lyase family protein, partial [Pseudomonadota bacterium]